MSIKNCIPSEVLKPYIKQFWGIDNFLLKDEKYIQRIIPDGLPSLILYIDNLPQITCNGRPFEDNFLLSGHRQQFYDIQLENKISVFSVVFNSQGLMKFFDFPFNEIYNNSIPFKCLNLKLEYDLRNDLCSVNLFEQRVKIAEKFFIKLLSNDYNKFDFKRIDYAMELIKSLRGRISIEKLADETCWSRKQFERKFSKHIGATPKKYLRTIRLQYSLFLKSKNRDMDILDIAFQCGFYDQAHFINDFKMLTGLTPKQFFDNHESYSDFFEF